MARRKFEFWCTECRLYFDFTLNTALSGWYRIHCPNCGHIHYRKVHEGEITEQRFSTNKDRDDPFVIEDICPMKASCRTFQKEKPKGQGFFLSELWKDLYEERTLT